MRYGISRSTVGAAVAALCLAGCSGGSTPSAPGVTPKNPGGTPANVITVGMSAFAPNAITVPVNATVTWNWDSCSNDPYNGQSCVSHSVAFDDTTLAGSAVQSSGSFAKAFAQPGVYTYHCSVHGTAMSGKVTVQ